MMIEREMCEKEMWMQWDCLLVDAVSVVTLITCFDLTSLPT